MWISFIPLWLCFIYICYLNLLVCVYPHCLFKNWDDCNRPAALRDPEERPMLSSHCSCHCLHLGIQGSLLSQVPLGLQLLSLWHTESSGPTCLTWLSSSLWGFPIPLQNSSLTSFIWDRLWTQHCNHTFKITSTFHCLSSLCSLRKN